MGVVRTEILEGSLGEGPCPLGLLHLGQLLLPVPEPVEIPLPSKHATVVEVWQGHGWLATSCLSTSPTGSVTEIVSPR